jgi:hypothetical protein
VKLFQQSSHDPAAKDYDTTTDAAGAFRVTGMREGIYAVSVDTQDYETGGDSSVRSTTLRVSVGAVVQMTLELDPVVAIRGKILDPEGAPIAGAKVLLRDAETPDETTSSGDGSYAFEHLPKGTYLLSARPETKDVTKDAMKNGAAQEKNRQELVETYYPNALDEDQSTRLKARPGAKLDGIDVRIQRAPVFSVHGVVRGADGKPAPNVKVMIGSRGRALSAMPGSLGPVRFYLPGETSLNPLFENVTTKEDGAFEFSSVREGDWILQAESEWTYTPETKSDLQLTGHVPVSVSGRDPDPVEILLAGTFDVKAAVEIDGDEKSTGPPPVSLLLQPEGQGRYAFGMPPEKAGDGVSFKQFVPGRYFLIPGFFGSMSSLYVARVYLGGQDVTGQAFELTATSPPLRIVYKHGASSIRGTITGGNRGTILAVPQKGSSDPTIVSVEAGAGTPFEMRGLTPGVYSVVAFDRVDSARLFEPAILEMLATLGSRVKAEENGNASVEVRVNHWPD